VLSVVNELLNYCLRAQYLKMPKNSLRSTDYGLQAALHIESRNCACA